MVRVKELPRPTPRTRAGRGNWTQPPARFSLVHERRVNGAQKSGKCFRIRKEEESEASSSTRRGPPSKRHPCTSSRQPPALTLPLPYRPTRLPPTRRTRPTPPNRGRLRFRRREAKGARSGLQLSRGGAKIGKGSEAGLARRVGEAGELSSEFSPLRGRSGGD